MNLGVPEGEEIDCGSEKWGRLACPVGAIIEVALVGSSVGLGTEGWFAFVIAEVDLMTPGGRVLKGPLLGCESESVIFEVARLLQAQGVHLCDEDPCVNFLGLDAIHATKVRLWTPEKFEADYLTKEGKAALKKAQKAERERLGTLPPRPRAMRARKESPGKTAKGVPKKPPTATKAKTGDRAAEDNDVEEVIPVLSEDDDGGDDREAPVAGANRAKLRKLLQGTRERILGGHGGAHREKDAEELNGGPRHAGSGRAAAASKLVAGTALNPYRQSSFPVAPLEDSRDITMHRSTRQTHGKDTPAAALLAQAVQASEAEARERRRKKKEKSRGDGVKELVRLLRGKGKNKKKRTSRRRSRSPPRRGGVKHDPDDSGGSGSSGSSTESSGDSRRRKSRSDDESDLSYEPPLRKKAAKSPGSVMQMLVKHAQEQLDRGALLESEGAGPGVTSGIKISTYFALLIRPNHPAGNPLLRELYALGQAIDLLRMGRLPETADALASRFIAVHTALSDGGWATASQLELYPLEPVQSATMSTMLQAQKHRRLIQKSQGWYGNSRFWGQTGRGKGGGANEKGKKGEPKGRGKGKGKQSPKEGSWSKAESNPWKENKEEAGKK